MLYGGEIFKNENYGKYFSLFQTPADPKSNLTLTKSGDWHPPRFVDFQLKKMITVVISRRLSATVNENACNNYLENMVPDRHPGTRWVDKAKTRASHHSWHLAVVFCPSVRLSPDPRPEAGHGNPASRNLNPFTTAWRQVRFFNPRNRVKHRVLRGLRFGLTMGH